MSDLATQKPNRSVRRQLTREQSKRERKEDKKLRKNAPDSVRFNSKKSRKVVPYNPIKAALIEKDTATPKKKDSLSEMFVPAVVTDKTPATMVTVAAASMPEKASEVNSSQEDKCKELLEDQEGEVVVEFIQQQQEPPLPELSSSLTPPLEETLKEISYESVTNEEEHNASGLTAAQDTVSINDETEFASINQSDLKENHDDETKNEAIATNVSAPGSDDDPIDKYDEAESVSNPVTTTNDETNVADTNKEIKEEVQKQQEHKKKEEEEEEATLQKDTTPAPSMTTSASISDKISPSTSTSSHRRKSTLISRLFKHKTAVKRI
ncbi:unnamed protein product [Mucor fragilis]